MGTSLGIPTRSVPPTRSNDNIPFPLFGPPDPFGGDDEAERADHQQHRQRDHDRQTVGEA